VKNEYSWKFHGGEKVLDNIHKDYSEDSVDIYCQDSFSRMNKEMKEMEDKKKKKLKKTNYSNDNSSDLFSKKHVKN
jgi:hypothetical protein